VINISSAYAEHCFKSVDILPVSSSCFKISSMTILNRVAHSGQDSCMVKISQVLLLYEQITVMY
jgi:hypothetical protein